MEPVLLTTKLFIPRVAPGLVLRPRLLQRFKDILNNVLTIISAPAGFGKTTLLSQWIHTNKPLIPTAWLSLDESENDPMRFWDYIIAALRTIQSGIGANSLTLLHSPQPLPIESVLIPLINDIAAISGETVLVLDDYHFIQSTPVHQGLIFFIEHMPPGIHLVISTRMDPLLPLPHFRGKGKMLEIGADDLRFTLEEAAELLKSVPGPALPPEEVRAINTRTEGWAVGLKMVVLSLSRHTDVKTAIAALTGSQRYIMDYLTDEVLRQLPEKMREFLLRTSILERLSAPLCDVVTGMSASQDILTELERANLFIVPLDELQQWYRYHHLFAELLRHHFEIEYPPETVAELQKKASEWHEVHGFKEEAVNYALAAQDWQKALDLVNTISSLFTYGGRTTYNWLRQIPQEKLLNNLQSGIMFAAALIFTGQNNEASAFLDTLEKIKSRDTVLAAGGAFMRLFIAAFQNDSRIEDYARKTLSLLSPDDSAYRAIVSLHLGIYYMLNQRVSEAEPLLTSTYEALYETGNLFLISQTLIWLADIAILRGKLHQAAEILKRAIGMAEIHSETAAAYLYLGIIYYCWNDLEAAIAEGEKAIVLNPSPGILIPAYLYNSYRRLCQGNVEAATNDLEQADRISNSADISDDERARVAAYHVQLALNQEDHVSVSHWLGQLTEYGGQIQDFPAAVVRLLYQEQSGKTINRLKIEYEKCRQEGLQMGLVRIRIAQAILSDQPEEALSYISDALNMAKPEGVIRWFVDWGMPLVPLLRQAIIRGIEPEYAHQLLTIIEAEERQRRIKKREISILSPTENLLSQREMEVLRFLADGISTHDIADRLVVSVNTVRTHIQHIFEKLDTKGRLQAVARAKELKLI